MRSSVSCPDLSVSDNGTSYGRRIYQTTLPRETGSLRVAIHVRGDPQRFAMRLRELAQATDPALRVIDPKPLSLLEDPGSAGLSYGFELMVSLTLVTLMLSLAGVYAVTAFSVARRTREIGVRVALGAQPRHILTTVFKRPLIQVAMGIGVGALLGSVSPTTTCRRCISMFSARRRSSRCRRSCAVHSHASSRRDGRFAFSRRRH